MIFHPCIIEVGGLCIAELEENIIEKTEWMAVKHIYIHMYGNKKVKKLIN